MQLPVINPSSWTEYELLDSGNFEKLERFGRYTLIRPEPQAIWQPVLSAAEWKQKAHAHFTREQKDKFRFTDEVKGGWKRLRDIPESWNIQYQSEHFKLILRLALTGFGHVGIFPEQGDNWNFVYDAVRRWKSGGRVLNLFAYTGAASVVAQMAGAEVTHCDASRPGLNWANQNMQMNNQKDIRWVYEDAFKFVRREVKRGNRYDGIIMDPPPYGRGPEGEKWTLQEQLDELIGMTKQLLSDQNPFFILSMYAVGLSALVGRNVVETHFPGQDLLYGEFCLQPRTGRPLPMGTFVRFRSGN
ncbi:MAG: class I SAM-dependent methyltransferase [Bacteroidetes bacterium]|nr:class I SAM-dependent methyltransferase [Bacteroidota bacterium]